MASENFSFHYSDNRKDKPDEDYLLLRDNVFIVFDGVSILFKDPYPNPSPAREAAKVASEEIYTYIQNNKDDYNPISVIRDSFISANKKVLELNIKLGNTPNTVDQINRQYAAAVGSFGFIKEDILYFGQLNDSGVMVFDQTQNMEIDFVLNHSPFVKLLTKMEKEGEHKPGSEEQHVFVRNEVVNNLGIEIEGLKLNFGVMNGDARVKDFLNVGCTNISSGQVALFYTDGFLPFVYDRNFVKKIFESDDKEDIDSFIKDKIETEDKYKKEKSLIALKF